MLLKILKTAAGPTFMARVGEEVECDLTFAKLLIEAGAAEKKTKEKDEDK